MTDREMLLLAYGALKATAGASPEVIKRIEGHLFPRQAIRAEVQPEKRMKPPAFPARPEKL